MNEQTIERRPIAARGLGVSRALSRLLVSARVTPNQISIMGMLLGVSAAVSLAATAFVPVFWWRVLFAVSAALIALRLLCNMLDGMVAVEQGKCSPGGELFNEIPDRISDTAILVGLGYALGGLPVLGFVAALVAIFTAYIRAVGKGVGAQQHFSGPMSKPQRMFTVIAAALFCAIAPVDWQQFGAATIALALITAGGVVASVRRLWLIRNDLRGVEA